MDSNTIINKITKLWWLAIPALASLVWLYFKFDPALNGFPACPFYTVTSIYCPGCGSQRAIHALLHGQIGQAASLNLMLVIFAPFLLWHYLHWVSNRLFNTGKSQFFKQLWVSRATLVLVLGFWLMRNIPVAPLNWLAP